MKRTTDLKSIAVVALASLSLLSMAPHANAKSYTGPGIMSGVAVAVIGLGFALVQSSKSGGGNSLDASAAGSAGLTTMAGGAGLLLGAGGWAIGTALAGEPDPVKAIEKTDQFKQFAKQVGEKKARKILLDIQAGLTPAELEARYPDVLSPTDVAAINEQLAKVHSIGSPTAVAKPSTSSMGGTH